MKGSRDKYNAGFIICDHLFPIIILKGNAPCAYNISFQEINSCLSCYKPMSLNPSLIRVCISLRVLHPHSIIFPFCSHWADVWNHDWFSIPDTCIHSGWTHGGNLWTHIALSSVPGEATTCSRRMWRISGLKSIMVTPLRSRLTHVWALGQMG